MTQQVVDATVTFNPEPLRVFMEREQRNQRWIARQSEVSEPTISKLLNNGDFLPDMRTVMRLAAVVECNPLDFYQAVGWPERT